MGTQGKAGAVKVDPHIHTRFKSACPLHGKQMQEAATEALEAMLLWWERGQSGDFVAFVDLMTQADGGDEAAESVEEAQACEGAGAAIAALWKLIQEDEQKEGGQ